MPAEAAALPKNKHQQQQLLPWEIAVIPVVFPLVLVVVLRTRNTPR